MRVVIDTNVFVSGLFFGGVPRRIVDTVIAHTITPCFTPTTLSELHALLMRDKFKKVRARLPFSITVCVGTTAQHGLVFPNPDHVSKVIAQDPADDIFLACAVIADATRIVSGDEHLRSLNSHAGIPILTPRTFVARYLIGT